ncbi:hypothetical protein, conserved [Eimeria brunetti]|uniref:Uncharacterized protein n=1 Tax=Eimeria brunetti TaxID=51314 RepID=U6LG19_9EIME|nr:hypothetical protein, conserved [Eimeria brunetti]
MRWPQSGCLQRLHVPGLSMRALILLLMLQQQGQQEVLADGVGTPIAVPVDKSHQGTQNAVYVRTSGDALVNGDSRRHTDERSLPFRSYNSESELRWSTARSRGGRRRLLGYMTAVAAAAAAALLGVVFLLLSCGVLISRSAKTIEVWGSWRRLSSTRNEEQCKHNTAVTEAEAGADGEGGGAAAAGEATAAEAAAEGDLAPSTGVGQNVFPPKPGASFLDPMAAPFTPKGYGNEAKGTGKRDKTAGKERGPSAGTLQVGAPSDRSETAAEGTVAAEQAAAGERTAGRAAEGPLMPTKEGRQLVSTPGAESLPVDPSGVPFTPTGYVGEGEGAGTRLGPSVALSAGVAASPKSSETAAEGATAGGEAAAGETVGGVTRPPLLWPAGVEQTIGVSPFMGTFLTRLRELADYCRAHFISLPLQHARLVAEQLARFALLEIAAVTPLCAGDEERRRQSAIQAFLRLGKSLGSRYEGRPERPTILDSLMLALHVLQYRDVIHAPVASVQRRAHARKQAIPPAAAALRYMASSINTLLQSLQGSPATVPSAVAATEAAVMSAVTSERQLQVLACHTVFVLLGQLQDRCFPGGIFRPADVERSSSRYPVSHGYPQATDITQAAQRAAAKAAGRTGQTTVVQRESATAGATALDEAQSQRAELAAAVSVTARDQITSGQLSSTGVEQQQQQPQQRQREQLLQQAASAVPAAVLAHPLPGVAEVEPPKEGTSATTGGLEALSTQEPKGASTQGPEAVAAEAKAEGVKVQDRGRLPFAQPLPRLFFYIPRPIYRGLSISPHHGSIPARIPFVPVPIPMGQQQQPEIQRHFLREQYLEPWGLPLQQQHWHGLALAHLPQQQHQMGPWDPSRQQQTGSHWGPFLHPPQQEGPLWVPHQQARPFPAQQQLATPWGAPREQQGQDGPWGALPQQVQRPALWGPALPQQEAGEPRSPSPLQEDVEPWINLSSLLDESEDDPLPVLPEASAARKDAASVLAPESSTAELDLLEQGAGRDTDSKGDARNNALFEGSGFAGPTAAPAAGMATDHVAFLPQQEQGQQQLQLQAFYDLSTGAGYTAPLRPQGETGEREAHLQPQQQQQPLQAFYDLYGGIGYTAPQRSQGETGERGAHLPQQQDLHNPHPQLAATIWTLRDIAETSRQSIIQSSLKENSPPAQHHASAGDAHPAPAQNPAQNPGNFDNRYAEALKRGTKQKPEITPKPK